MLVMATAGIAAVGVGLSAVPFIESWEPSESALARGAPVDVSISNLKPATMRTVIWRRQPIFIVRRTPEMIAELPHNDVHLRDPHSREPQQPAYADNEYRSRRPPILVLIGVCTHLGCLPKSRFAAGDATLGANWPGGFYCPCHGSTYDMAGRVFRDVPAPLNLVVPAYDYVDNNLLRIGVDHAAESTS